MCKPSKPSTPEQRSSMKLLLMNAVSSWTSSAN